MLERRRPDRQRGIDRRDLGRQESRHLRSQQGCASERSSFQHAFTLVVDGGFTAQ